MDKQFFADKPAEPMAKPTRSLVDHTADVMTAFVALFGDPEKPTDLTWRWLSFFKLDESDLRSFLRNGLMACLVHDWGKANTGFSEDARHRTGAADGPARGRLRPHHDPTARSGDWLADSNRWSGLAASCSPPWPGTT